MATSWNAAPHKEDLWELKLHWFLIGFFAGLGYGLAVWVCGKLLKDKCTSTHKKAVLRRKALPRSGITRAGGKARANGGGSEEADPAGACAA